MKKEIKSELRKSYLLDKYVIITPGRAKRPRDVKEETVIKRSGKCPFCVENLSDDIITDRIDDEKGEWLVASIKNIFPAVTLDNSRAYGTQEVIIETPDHTKELANLKESEIKMLLNMYAKRTAELSKIDKLDYILCFKNQGSKAGASIVHAHSQVFATNVIPPDLREEQVLAQGHKIQHGTCAYCDIVEKEMKSERKIYEDDYVATFAPYASQYHYEAWVFPKRHVDNISQFTKEEISSYAKVLKKITKKLHSIDLSFNYFMHQIVSDKNQHFYLKIQPRDSVWAGVELGSGLVINSVPPEVAAEFYRE